MVTRKYGGQEHSPPELLKRCRVRLLALDEFQHFVDVRQANIRTMLRIG